MNGALFCQGKGGEGRWREKEENKVDRRMKMCYISMMDLGFSAAFDAGGPKDPTASKRLNVCSPEHMFSVRPIEQCPSVHYTLSPCIFCTSARLRCDAFTQICDINDALICSK